MHQETLTILFFYVIFSINLWRIYMDDQLNWHFFVSRFKVKWAKSRKIYKFVIYPLVVVGVPCFIAGAILSAFHSHPGLPVFEIGEAALLLAGLISVVDGLTIAIKEDRRQKAANKT